MSSTAAAAPELVLAREHEYNFEELGPIGMPRPLLDIVLLHSPKTHAHRHEIGVGASRAVAVADAAALAVAGALAEAIAHVLALRVRRALSRLLASIHEPHAPMLQLHARVVAVRAHPPRVSSHRPRRSASPIVAPTTGT